MASNVEAQEIRVQLAELSEHILRRLSLLLARARAQSAASYGEIEATARDMTDVQRQLMTRLAEPVSRREELPLLMSLMRVQDRALSVLEQLERLPFNREPAPLPLTETRTARSNQIRPPEPAYAARDALRQTPRPSGPVELAPWPEETLDEPAYVPAASHVDAKSARARPAQAAVPDRPAGKLDTRSSVGQPLPTVGKPVRTRADVGGPRPVRAPAPPAGPPPTAKEPDSSVPDQQDRQSAPPEPAERTRSRRNREPPPETKTNESKSKGALVPLIAGAKNILGSALTRQVPRVMLSSVFIVLGLVFVMLVGRLFMSVFEELGSRRSPPEPTISTERLPPEGTSPLSVTEFGGRPSRVLPATGEAFVVVLSTHADAAAAQRQFSEMRQRIPAALTGLSPDVQPIEGAGGFRYRLALAPPMARERALNLCAEIKAAGFAACWLRRLQR